MLESLEAFRIEGWHYNHPRILDVYYFDMKIIANIVLVTDSEYSQFEYDECIGFRVNKWADEQVLPYPRDYYGRVH